MEMQSGLSNEGKLEKYWKTPLSKRLKAKGDSLSLQKNLQESYDIIVVGAGHAGCEAAAAAATMACAYCWLP